MGCYSLGCGSAVFVRYAHTCLPRSLLMFTMENCFYLLISQAVRYLRDPAVHPRDKQRMKQELSSELVWLLGWSAGKAIWGLPVLWGQEQWSWTSLNCCFSCRARCFPASQDTSEGEPPAPLLLESCPRRRARPPLSPKPAQSLRSP